MPPTILELTPHGVVICRGGELGDFAESDAAGLIALSGQKQSLEADASVKNWENATGPLKLQSKSLAALETLFRETRA